LESLIDCAVLPDDCKSNLQQNGYYSGTHQLLYVATPKAACTTLKWWFADLIGQTVAVRSAPGSPESSPELVIHDALGRVAPGSACLTPAEISQAINNPDCFRFCLVRNPFSRIFSAWQSKWLLREPLQIGPYRKHAFYNLPVTNIAEVAMAFEAFLEFLNSVEFPNILDQHVKLQYSLLCPDRIRYSVVGKLEDSTELCKRLSVHLGSAYKPPFSFGQRNESLIIYHPTLITARAEELIRTMYAADFDHFRYSTTKPSSQGELNENALRIALAAVRMLRGRHQRIGEMWAEYHANMEYLQNRLLQLQQIIDQQQLNFANLDNQRQQAREEIVRAEAQLALLKELWLGDGLPESL